MFATTICLKCDKQYFVTDITYTNKLYGYRISFTYNIRKRSVPK